ncbi:unnamed protein product, partial [Porites lobata]
MSFAGKKGKIKQPFDPAIRIPATLKPSKAKFSLKRRRLLMFPSVKNSVYNTFGEKRKLDPLKSFKYHKH